MVGRRGPAQAAFTTPELQELGELAGADVVVDPADLELDPASEASLEDNTTARRNVEILREYATRERTDKPKAVTLRFLWSPVAINGEERVESIELVRNELSEDGSALSRRARPRRSSAGSSCGASAIAACEPGRAVRRDSRDDSQRERTRPRRVRRARSRLYCTGWIKRGPSGIIGTNKKDATETVELLLEDAAAGRLGAPRRTERPTRSRRSSPSAAPPRSSTTAGRRSTRTSAPPASRTAVRASSSARGTSCSLRRSASPPSAPELRGGLATAADRRLVTLRRTQISAEPGAVPSPHSSARACEPWSPGWVGVGMVASRACANRSP